MYYRDTLAKSQVLSFNSVVICVELLQLTKLAEYGMSEVENACQY